MINPSTKVVARTRSKSITALALMVAACASVPSAGKTPVAPGEVSNAGKPQVLSASADLRPRKQLPDEAREMLTARMMRHGDEMGALTTAVLMLEYDLAHTLAADMAEEPKLGRPAPGETGTLNALLPSEFFVQQDALVTSARALASAAEGHDDMRLVASFGDVARSCVGCHSAYLNAELDSADAAPDRTTPCNPEEPCGENEQR